MSRSGSALLVLLLAGGLPRPLLAQASPYLPLDDPRLPLIEHLIARGDLDDPSPLVRPFRRADLARALDRADSAAAGTSAAVAALREAFADPGAEAWWRLEGRVGAQAYTRARRDLLHPAGPDGARPYVDLGAAAVFGPLAVVTRPAIEPRLTVDPDWPGRRDLSVAGRQVEAYLSAQWRWVRLFYGQMDHHWGTADLTPLAVSAEAYPRQTVGLEVGVDRLRLSALAAALQDETDSLGRVIHRYFFAHRLAVRPTSRLTLALWETTVLSGPDRNFDGRYQNPVSLLLLANAYGLGDNGNVLLGLDLDWRPSRRTRLQAQLAIDDLQYRNRSGPTRTPDRYALAVAFSGALGRSAAWRAGYARATSLAFRTSDPFESFTEAGVGLGPSFADNDRLLLGASFPVAGRWLLAPELGLQRQGEGRLDAPFPADGTARGDTPTLFIGTVERTWLAGMRLSGRQGPVDLDATLGYHHVTNAGHVPGLTRDRLEGRVQATLGLRRQGVFR